MIDYNGMTSDEIKADIERTRNQMSNKIDTLQDRLSPDNLKQQAQTMVQDVVKESTDALIEYVNTNAQQMTNTILEAIRNNPVPAAVVGLGLGWLIMSSVKSGSGNGGNGGYGGNGGNGGNYYAGADRMNRQMPSQSDYATYTGDMGAQGYATGAGGSMRSGGHQDWSQGGGGAVGNWNESSGNEGGGIGQKAGEVAGQVKDTAQQVADKVVHGASQITEPAANMGAQLKHQVGDVTSQAQEQAQRIGYQAQHMGAQAGRQAQHMGGQMQRTVQRSLEDNPLGFGVVALAAGIALGLALPATRPERQLMGDMSTRVLEKTQNAASNVMEEVKQVAAETAPKLQETAKRVADDVAQTGREATRDVKDTLKQAASQVGVDKEGEQQGTTAWQSTGSTGYEPSTGTSSTGSTGSGSMSGSNLGGSSMSGGTTGGSSATGSSFTEKGYQGSILQSGSYAGSASKESAAEDDATFTGDGETAPDADTDSSATTNPKR